MRFKIRLLAVGVLAWLATNAASAQSNLSEMSRAQLDRAIHDYIMANPDVIAQSMEVLQQRMNAAAAADEKDKITSSLAQLQNDKADVELGNPHGDVTMVEFFDYNCHYCKNALSDVVKLVEDDKNLRVVLKDYPILGPNSVDAAKVAIALRDQLTPQKYEAFHTALMGRKGLVTKEIALQTAEAAGADLSRLNEALGRPEVQTELQKTLQLGQSLGVTGTPGFFVGSERIVGAVGYDAMKKKIEAVRKCGQAVCG